MNRRRIAQAATIIMLGNLVTSVLGYFRQEVTAAFFTRAQTDAWFAAYTVPQMFYDLIIGGAIAAALIPTFTRLAESDQERYWRVVATIFVLASAAVVVLIGILEAAANPLMWLIASGFRGQHNHGRLGLSVELVRVILPTLFFWGLSAVSLAALYSIGRRIAASFATACFHLGIIAGAVVLGGAMGLGPIALPLGAIAGAASQFLVQVPSLWRGRKAIGVWVGQRVDFRDPAVRQIVVLYGPVALGIVVSILGQVADIEFKTHLHQSGWYSDMQYATTLVQFPVGIVVAALGLAVLPMISSDAAADRIGDLKEKLGLGFRVILALMLPAALGLMLLGQPIAQLLFQHGHLHGSQADQIGRALLGYGPQLPFIGIDQLLIFAFYARQNTLTPMLAGVAGVCVYVAFAFLLFPLQVLGLAIANTIQISFHAVLLMVLLVRAIGWIESRQVLVAAGKVLVATALMSAAIIGVRLAIGSLPSQALSSLWNVLAPFAAAVGVYAAALYLLRLDEVWLVRNAVRARLGRAH